SSAVSYLQQTKTPPCHVDGEQIVTLPRGQSSYLEVSNGGTALPERPNRSAGRVSRRLTLQLSIELGPEQHSKGGQIRPGQEHHHGPKQTQRLIGGGEVPEIKRKPGRAAEPQGR